MKIGFIHIKVFATHVDNGRVNLYPINRDRTIDLGKLVGNSAGGKTNYTDAVQFLWLEASVKIGCGKIIIPVPAC